MLNGTETITYRPENETYTYIGTIEKSEEDNCYWGKVLDIDALITYESDTKEGLIESFHSAVDDYIKLTNESKSEIKFHNEADITIKCNTCVHDVANNAQCKLGYYRIYCGPNDYGMLACLDKKERSDTKNEE